MSREITRTTSVRRHRDGVLMEDKEIEHGRASLLRVTFLTPEQALDLGREMMRLGLEAARTGAPPTAEAKPASAQSPSMRTLDFAPRTDPYPEDRIETSREGTAR